jgi:hypothetical protein
VFSTNFPNIFSSYSSVGVTDCFTSM